MATVEEIKAAHLAEGSRDTYGGKLKIMIEWYSKNFPSQTKIVEGKAALDLEKITVESFEEFLGSRKITLKTQEELLQTHSSLGLFKSALVNEWTSRISANVKNRIFPRICRDAKNSC